MESLYFLILFVIIVIFLIPIRIKVMISYNPINNIGTFALIVFGIKISNYIFKIRGRYMLIRYENKRKEVKLAYDGPQMRFYNQFNVQIRNKVNAKNLEIFTNIGLNDAYDSAILSGLVISLINLLVSRIKNAKPTCNLNIVNFTSFNELNMQAVINAKISISIFDVVYSLIMASLIVRRNEKYLH